MWSATAPASLDVAQPGVVLTGLDLVTGQVRSLADDVIDCRRNGRDEGCRGAPSDDGQYPGPETLMADWSTAPSRAAASTAARSASR